ncbi:hypothetical protein I4U23_016102 [Adineta vaga]|nr:hypothetical protein I4U23_016102 [Adineta vaga]
MCEGVGVDCYIYQVVNTALRENDEKKVSTLGPFCYLLLNHIGQDSKEKSSFRDRVHRVLHPNETHSVIVYRGDSASDEVIEEYKKAIEDKKNEIF